MKKPSLNLKKPSLGALPGGSRTGQSLLAAAAVLAVVLGIAELRPPVHPALGVTGKATDAQVERTALVCPQPLQGITGATTLTAYAPPGAAASGGTGTVNDVAPQAPGGGDQPNGGRVALAKPGVPVTGNAANGDTAPGTIALGTGSYAPGFTADQITTVTDSHALGMSGIQCEPSGTSFWFSGASTADGREDYVSLINNDNTPAVVDLKLYGDKGLIDAEAASGIAVAPGSSQSILLPTITKGVNDLAVHVVARSGRVAAFLHAADGSHGADWVPASPDPAPVQAMPGLPADLTAARLVVLDPGDDDADLKIQISGKNGWFTPAGHESIHVKAGMVNAVDLGTVTRGEVGAIRLSPSDPQHPTPVIAAVRVDRAQNGKSDSAWLTGTQPVGKRATVADNRGGGASTIYLTSAGDAAGVHLTASAGTGGGTPATKDIQIPAGATVALQAPEPNGLNGSFAITLETTSGGPVVAARMLAVPTRDVPMFTIQEFHDDHSNVHVPQAAQDPALLVRP